MSIPLINVTLRNGDAVSWTVFVQGEVCLYTSPELEKALGEAIERGAKQIAVDMSGVTFLSGDGIKTLVRAYKRVRDYCGGRITVKSCAPHVRRVFEIAGLTEYFKVTCAA